MHIKNRPNEIIDLGGKEVSFLIVSNCPGATIQNFHARAKPGQNRSLINPRNSEGLTIKDATGWGCSTADYRNVTPDEWKGAADGVTLTPGVRLENVHLIGVAKGIGFSSRCSAVDCSVTGFRMDGIKIVGEDVHLSRVKMRDAIPRATHGGYHQDLLQIHPSGRDPLSVPLRNITIEDCDLSVWHDQLPPHPWQVNAVQGIFMGLGKANLPPGMVQNIVVRRNKVACTAARGISLSKAAGVVVEDNVVRYSPEHETGDRRPKILVTGSSEVVIKNNVAQQIVQKWNEGVVEEGNREWANIEQPDDVGDVENFEPTEPTPLEIVTDERDAAEERVAHLESALETIIKSAQIAIHD